MPKKKLTILPGRENSRVNCFAFYINKAGNPACHALSDIYCLKERLPCPFCATPDAASAARMRAMRRLDRLGRQ